MNENIIRNDITGIEDRSMYKSMLEALRVEKVYVKDNLLTSEHLNKIQYLHLNEILDLRGIEYCSNIKTLVVANTKISDISPVASLKSLECLSLACNDLEDISPISGLINLKRLYLGHNMIEDISPISELENLEQLSLRGNMISDINAMAKLTNITHLSLEENQIQDISVLSQLVNLRSLDISDNDIQDICALENVYNMEYLYMSYNDINDISPLVGMMNLVKLEVKCNDITLDHVDQNLFFDFVNDEQWIEANGFVVEEHPLIEKCKDIKAKLDDHPIISRELDREALPNKRQAIIVGASVVAGISAIAMIIKKRR